MGLRTSWRGGIPVFEGQLISEPATMRAVVCRGFEGIDGLMIERLPIPEPEPGEVRVKVVAAGVNFADMLMISGRYQVKPPLPFVPGSEFCGFIDALGPDVAGWNVGEAVMGASVEGGYYAEYGRARAARLAHWPEGLPPEVAAGMFIGHGTAWFALLRRGALQAGETVVITGAGGGVGVPAIEVAKRAGAFVIAAASSAEKLEIARSHGADALINYGTHNLREEILALTDGRGYDVLFDTIGGDLFDQALRVAAPYARLLVVGFASGRIPAVPANRLLLKNISVVGVGGHAVTLGAGDELRRQVEELAALHAGSPFTSAVTAEYGLDDAGLALTRLANRDVVGKLLIRP